MGTRSTTTFSDEQGNKVVTMYRHYDGYLKGHGIDFASYLAGKKLVNGISSKDDINKIFNGMGCLSASVVANFKSQPGGIYLYSAGIKQRFIDYEYHVYCKDNQIRISVDDFDGTPEEMLEYIKNYEESED